MMPKTDADLRSPWYEAFTPWMKVPAPWAVASEAESPAPAEPDPADEEWTTEAIFDYYND